eukprot:TRINITY_DN1410_c0_g1_i2.p1 TRINITY_DN1410_c0_g1~~TRINITY_DN1410_c0_g1_i2.p1  ORF type:complete len:647 (-),score=96.99 TRINITY_DN1410_c0_g1_i2:298-2238(-)
MTAQSAVVLLRLCSVLPTLWVASAGAKNIVQQSSGTCGSALLQRTSKVAAQSSLFKDLVDLPLEPVDGGEGRACRGAYGGDNSASYYTLFENIATIEECMEKCVGTPTTTTTTTTIFPNSCPITTEGQTFGNVGTSQINECSGLAASRNNPGLYWVNNDSGDGPKLYGIDKAGKHIARVAVNGAQATDWEDVAAGPGPEDGKNYIYVGDIGDNYRQRGSVQIYRFEDPLVPNGQDRNADIRVNSQRFEIRYPDGAHDCEAMFVDQGSAAEQMGTKGRIYIITKGDGTNSDPRWKGGDVYWVDLPSNPVGALMFTHAGHVPISWVTGADLTSTGSLIAVRSYGEVLMWPRSPGSSAEAALTVKACSANRKDEKQGESVAFGVENDHYVTVSEGDYAPVWYFMLPGSFEKAVRARVSSTSASLEASIASAAPCQGIEYSKAGRCEVWTRPGGIRATIPKSGYTCLRNGPAPSNPLPNPSMPFLAINGGENRACRGSDSLDNNRGYYKLFNNVQSLDNCKQMCLLEPLCKGIEFRASNGRCEVWTRDAGIGSSAEKTGYTCLRLGPWCGTKFLQDVEKVCESSRVPGCKVLADKMTGKTCREYCTQNGLACAGGWEEENENCVVIADLGCDQTFGTTSDLICECLPPSS